MGSGSPGGIGAGIGEGGSPGSLGGTGSGTGNGSLGGRGTGGSGTRFVMPHTYPALATPHLGLSPLVARTAVAANGGGPTNATPCAAAAAMVRA